MRKYLLPEKGQFYKANMHAHTFMSDGKNSPEEVKEIFMGMGYSIVAYTDHDVYVDRSHLCDENFLALNGVEEEIDGDFKNGYLDMEHCHLNFIALEQDNLNCPCYHRTKYFFGNAPQYRHLVKFDPTLPDYERSYTHECINDMLSEGKRRGFYTVHNHPGKALENYPIYSGYNEMNAVEIYNGTFSDDQHVYDEQLLLGKRIHCLGGDDSHSRENSGHSFTMIKAEKLEYRAVTDALVKGHFYASRGPEIKELYVEDGVIHIETSEAKEILFVSAARHPGRLTFRAKPGETITQADFKVLPACRYVRVVVTDFDGCTACSNAYFVDELLES